MSGNWPREPLDQEDQECFVGCRVVSDLIVTQHEVCFFVVSISVRNDCQVHRLCGNKAIEDALISPTGLDHGSGLRSINLRVATGHQNGDQATRLLDRSRAAHFGPVSKEMDDMSSKTVRPHLGKICALL